MFFQEMKSIVEKLECGNIRFHLREMQHPYVGYLQVEADMPDAATGDPSEERGRKWMMSIWMTPSEVVQTAFKAVLTFVEHETRENFKYKGRAIFGPHFDVEKLVGLADLGEAAVDARKSASVHKEG